MLDFFLTWLRYFFPAGKKLPTGFYCLAFLYQKILRVNNGAKWPVHYTSKVLYPDRVVLGYRCAPGFSPHCYIQAKNGIIIGSNVRIAPGVGLISAGHDLNDYDKHNECNSIQIGNNVWIGMNSVILPGVQIGDNVVIGAGSIVTSDIPSNSIAVGNPCKVIKETGPYLGRDYS